MRSCNRTTNEKKMAQPLFDRSMSYLWYNTWATAVDANDFLEVHKCGHKISTRVLSSVAFRFAVARRRSMHKHIHRCSCCECVPQRAPLHHPRNRVAVGRSGKPSLLRQERAVGKYSEACTSDAALSSSIQLRSTTRRGVVASYAFRR